MHATTLIARGAALVAVGLIAAGLAGAVHAYARTAHTAAARVASFGDPDDGGQLHGGPILPK